jgi:hypothetical protein
MTRQHAYVKPPDPVSPVGSRSSPEARSKTYESSEGTAGPGRRLRLRRVRARKEAGDLPRRRGQGEAKKVGFSTEAE